MKVDSGVETDDKWVAVVYGGTTRYVSADYVTTSLAWARELRLKKNRQSWQGSLRRSGKKSSTGHGSDNGTECSS